MYRESGLVRKGDSPPLIKSSEETIKEEGGGGIFKYGAGTRAIEIRYVNGSYGAGTTALSPCVQSYI